ncbi:M48 family metallopeptidase [Bremerella sp. JC770]|uniref:M48 family metallopeptidase n=1 Tax=Bremerella sp. JC770 TaxID=3232137 RepID=UPI00345AF481
MSNPFDRLGFARTFVFPALSLFLIPAVALVVGNDSEKRFTQDLVAKIAYEIQKSANLNQRQKDHYVAQARETSTWKLVNKQQKDLARWSAAIGPFTLPTFLMYRAIFYVSWICIGLGAASLLIAGLGAVLAQGSRAMQYVMLLTTWHMTSIVGVIELCLQTALLVGLATAELFYFSGYAGAKILVIVIGAGLTGLTMAIAAMFKPLDNRLEASGIPIQRSHSPRFWQALDELCEKVGTTSPDHVIAGINDGFWVTQFPVVIQEDEIMRRTYRGRTLYVSLPLLKQLPGKEADAILCHEMAHFSGQDTFYSLRVAPLLERHHAYAESLGDSWITLPVHYFASLLLVINNMSFSHMKRQREFRADQIATEQTSVNDFAFGFLRAVAFSEYRQQCESEWIDATTPYEQVSLAQSLEQGFRPFAMTYFDDHPIGDMTNFHPIDTHPPIHARMEAIGYAASVATLRSALADQSPGPWYEMITNAETLELSQWSELEEAFREYHEALLVHRLLPTNDHERTLVEKHFPPLEIEVSRGRTLRLDYEKVGFQDWQHDVYYHEIETLNIERGDVIWVVVDYQRLGMALTAKIPLSGIPQEEAYVREVLERYSNRSDFAHDYHRQRKAALAANPEPNAPGMAETLDFASNN